MKVTVFADARLRVPRYRTKPGVVLDSVLMEARVRLATAAVTMDAGVRFTYPCVRGDVATGNVSLFLDFGEFVLNNLTVGRYQPLGL